MKLTQHEQRFAHELRAAAPILSASAGSAQNQASEQRSPDLTATLPDTKKKTPL